MVTEVNVHSWLASRRVDTSPTSKGLIPAEEDFSDDYSTKSSQIVRNELILILIKSVNIPPNPFRVAMLPQRTAATEWWKAQNALEWETIDDVSARTSRSIRKGTRFTETIRKIEALRGLEDGWAGEDSVAPSEETISDALKFIALLPDTVPAPLVTPASDGEIVLEWFADSKKAVVGFEGDGHFGYALFREGKFRPGVEDGSLEENRLPEDFLEYFQSMTET
jgi:hypothetical protein